MIYLLATDKRQTEYFLRKQKRKRLHKNIYEEAIQRMLIFRLDLNQKNDNFVKEVEATVTSSISYALSLSTPHFC